MVGARRLKGQALAVLQAVKERRVHAGVFRYNTVCRLDNDVAVTRSIMSLKRNGLVDLMYFSNNRAAVNITEAGDEALKHSKPKEG